MSTVNYPLFVVHCPLSTAFCLLYTEQHPLTMSAFGGGKKGLNWPSGLLFMASSTPYNTNDYFRIFDVLSL